MSSIQQPNTPVDTAELSAAQKRLNARLGAFRSRVRSHLLVDGLARFVAIVLGLAMLSLILDRWLNLSAPVRVVGTLAGLGAIGYAAWRFLILPTKFDDDLVSLAAALDQKASAQPAHKPVAPHVATVLQLPDLLGDENAVSPIMVRSAVLRSDQALTGVNFESHLNRKRFQTAASLVVILLVLPTLWSALNPSLAGLWLRRWFLASSQPWPRNTVMVIEGLRDGRIVVPRGEPWMLRVAIKDSSVVPDSVALRTKPAGASWSSVAMTRFSDKDFRYDFAPQQEPMSIRLIAGDDDTGTISVEPVDRPRVADLTLTARHPAAKEAQVFHFSGRDTDPSFLARTEIELDVTAASPVSEARITNATAQPSGLVRQSETRYTAKWTHDKPVTLQIELVDAATGLASLPVPVSVGLRVDQPPRVTLAFTGVRQRITPQAKIPLSLGARDESAITQAGLEMKIDIVEASGSATQPSATQPDTTQPASSGPPATKLTLFGPTMNSKEKEVLGKHTLEVASLKAPVGAILNITGVAQDDCFAGAQTGRSRTVGFRVVSPEELFRDILVRQQAERVRFRRTRDEAQKLKETIEKAETPEAMSQAARQVRQLMRDSARTHANLTDLLTEMKLNALGGKESYDLMENNVLAPLKKLQDELMSTQRDALDALSQKVDTQARKDAADREERIAGTMTEILRQMSQWDSFVDVINQLNEVIKIETGVKEQTEKEHKKTIEGVFNP